MTIDVLKKNAAFFQCFSSDNKLYIIELLREKPRNILELATIIGVSSTIITRYILAMEEAGIVKSEMVPAKRGKQKICQLNTTSILLDMSTQAATDEDITELVIPIGQFSDFQIEPTCGLASTTNYIGMVDDPRYFSNPVSATAGLVWFESGHIKYTLPSYLFDHSQTIQSIEISLEICSEYPHFKNEHPSDIVFSLNDVTLGVWTSPGCFGGKKGLYTPAWFTCGTEFGLLKRIRITPDGTYIDGEKLSDVSIKDLDLNSNTNQVLKIDSPKTVQHPGGITLFGKGFGNHNQDIVVRIFK